MSCVVRSVAALVVVAVAAGACTSEPAADPSPDPLFPSESAEPSASETPSADESPSASSSAEPSPSGTAQDVDITTTPPFDEIDAAWVDAVVNELFTTFDEEIVRVLEAPEQEFVEGVPAQLPEGMVDRVDDVYRGELLGRRLADLRTIATNLDGGRDIQVLPEEGRLPRLWETVVVQYAQPDCIIAAGYSSRRGLRNPQDDDIPVAISLASKPDDVGSDVNPTEWVMIDLVPNTDPDGNRLPDESMFNADLAYYSGGLDNNCVETS